MKDKFPYEAWVLGGTFIPKKVEIIGYKWGDKNYPHSGSKTYYWEDLYLTKEEAIASGHERLADQERILAKRQASIDKKRTNLIKHT